MMKSFEETLEEICQAGLAASELNARRCHMDEAEIQYILAVVKIEQEKWKAEARAEYLAKRSYLGVPIN